MSDSSASSRPLTTLPAIILTTGPFVFLWSMLHKYIARHGPSRIVFPLITRLNSQLYALFSLGLFYCLLNTYFNFHSSTIFSSYPLRLRIFNFDLNLASVEDLGFVYHYSKFYEYIDVFNLVAQGRPIGSHMAFHHLTTPFWTYFRVLNAESDWRVFAACNALHHALMYAYFGGVWEFLGVGARMRTVIMGTGYVQLVAGLAVDAVWLVRMRIGMGEGEGEKVLGGGDGGEGSYGDEATNRVISMLLLGRYLMLYVRELKEGSGQKRVADVRSGDGEVEEKKTR